MMFRAVVFLLLSFWFGTAAPLRADSVVPVYKPINDSTIDGRYRHRNDSNQLVFEGKYKNGLRNGIFKEYDATGLLIKKSKYKKGKVRWQQFYANGKIYATIDKKGVYRKRSDCGC